MRSRAISTAEQRFKEINEAYDVLRDPQKRAAYDRFGHQAFEAGMGGGRGGAGFGPEFTSSMSDIFEDLFGEFMGGGRGRGGQGGGGRRGGASRGADLRYNMEISLTEAFAGKTAQIRVPSSVNCDHCSGTGAKPGTSPKTCTTCGGVGAVRSTPGLLHRRAHLPDLPGPRPGHFRSLLALRRPGSRHARAHLVGQYPGRRRGWHAHQTWRAKARPACAAAPSGDLYIFLSIRPHEFFQRDGADLFCKVPISMTAAAMGGEIEVPTIDGKKARVTIPEGAQTGKQFRLKSKGMPVLRSAQSGDLYIQVTVETPVNLSRRQRELLKEFEREARNNSPQSEGFFAKAKAFWEGFGS